MGGRADLQPLSLAVRTYSSLGLGVPRRQCSGVGAWHVAGTAWRQ